MHSIIHIYICTWSAYKIHVGKREGGVGVFKAEHRIYRRWENAIQCVCCAVIRHYIPSCGTFCEPI